MLTAQFAFLLEIIIFGETLFVFHVPAYPNGRITPNSYASLFMSDCWRRGGTTSACYAHCYATDYCYSVFKLQCT